MTSFAQKRLDEIANLLRLHIMTPIDLEGVKSIYTLKTQFTM